jgi:glycosyltransferase involved in cell wall biosynthesis
MKVLHVFTLFCTARSFFDGQFAYLGEHGYDIHLVTSPDDNTDDFVRRNKISYHPMLVSRSISPLQDIKTIWNLVKLIRKEKFDVVVGHTPKGALVAMIAAALTLTPKRVYYRHGLIYTTATGVNRFIFKTVERVTALFATQIVNVSPSLSKLAVKDHLNAGRKQSVIGEGTCGGIDAQHIFNPSLIDANKLVSLRQKYGITNEDLIVGFCGRLCRDKGIIELIDGFNQFTRTHQDQPAKLLLVGDYDKRDILPDNIKKAIAESPNIISTGHVDKTEIPYYYSMMDMFVFPSYREGFGMCVIEASAMERPILVSRSHGCIDSIREGETGYYIDLSAEGIKSGIERLLDPAERLRIGKQGREFVLSNFDHPVMWPKVLNMYQSL